MADTCTFSTYGYACGKPIEHGRYLCEEHAAAKCSNCGQPATHGCDFCGQFVCGAPLCDECTFGTDNSKPSGTWGFLNHVHISKPEFADKHENARLKASVAFQTAALAERDAEIATLRKALPKAVMEAIVTCRHDIDGDRVILFESPRQEGLNAYAQLSARVRKAIDAALSPVSGTEKEAPAPVQNSRRSDLRAHYERELPRIRSYELGATEAPDA